MESRRTMGTMLVAPSKMKGDGCHALVKKQMYSTGAHDWLTDAPSVEALTCGYASSLPPAAQEDIVLSAPAWPTARLDAWNGDRVLKLLLECTDGGSDEVFARNCHKDAVKRKVTTWVFDVN